MTQKERKDFRDAMTIIKRKCYEVEEYSVERRILGRIMAHLYFNAPR